MEMVTFKATANYDFQVVYDSVDYILTHHQINKLVTAESKILLKPNMLSKNSPEKTVTTNPQVVAAVAKWLINNGAIPENITLADSSGGPSSPAILSSNYETCGFAKVARDYKLRLYTDMQTVARKCDGAAVREFEMMAPAAESDIIINLAKAKTHVMTGMTGATKNLFGVIPGLKKAEFHLRFQDKTLFGNMICDLAQLISPTFSIIDAVVAMEGDGPAGGIPREIGLLMGSSSVFNLDFALCHIMGINPEEIPVGSAAIKRGLGKYPLAEGDIDGDAGLFKPIEGFLLPASYSITFEDNVPKPLRGVVKVLASMLESKPHILKNKCIGCGKCRDICPRQIITINEGKAQIDLSRCLKCFCCHEMCPVKAIDVKKFRIFNW